MFVEKEQGCILDIVEITDKYDFKSGELPPTKIMLEAFDGVIRKMLKERDPSINDTWINENITGVMMLRLITEIIMPLVDELTVSANTIGNSQNTKKK